MAQQVAPSTGLTPVPDHDFMPLNGIHHVELFVGKGAELSQLLSTLASADADLKRLSAVREARAAEAAAYFKANAAEWERIRSLHAPDKDVEAAIARLMAGRTTIKRSPRASWVTTGSK